MNVQAMPIKALAPWFGGKRTLAPLIVEELGPHGSYWEPFCGSMAVLMRKGSCRMETVNDLHGDLINLARVIQDGVQGPALYRRLRRVMMHEEMMRQTKDALAQPAADPLDRAFWFFLQSWVARNGVAGTREHNQHFCRRFTANGGHPAVRLESAVASIPAWRRRLRRVCILSMDGLEMLERIEDAPDAAIYCDPPYFEKGGEYLHDFADADHGRLAEILRRFRRARVIVSYYDDERLAGLYPGWTKVRKTIAKNMGTGNRRGTTKVEAPEVLLINGPSVTEVQTPLFGEGF